MRKRILLAVVILALAGAGGWAIWNSLGENGDSSRLVLYGNVDLRQVDLAFKDVERVAEVRVEEGESVEMGRTVAVLETERLRREIEGLRARIGAQEAMVRKLESGSREQEIAAARAEVAAARAELVNAERTLARRRELLRTGATPRQAVDDARAVRDVAAARVKLAQERLELTLAGPRDEDIEQARAQLTSLEAELSAILQRLEDASLVSPSDGVVRSRLLEPGDMASPQRPVLTLALMDPKWVRTYVSETNLGRLREGMAASVTTDSFPDSYPGWVGFISPMAEFTPRNVETPELRTSLVYEVRIFVRDPDNELRLGMPATVTIDLPPRETSEDGREGAGG